MRDRSIDVSRGLLVVMMLYGHVLQFFGEGQLFPQVAGNIDIINILVFPTFVFCFGRTAALAYLSKDWKKALPGMARTLARSLGAFWLSGLAYRVLREGKPLGVGTVRLILLLQDIPGWSEFLISFALYALLLLVLFPAFRALAKHPLVALGVGVLCLGCCFLPYESIQVTQLSLLVGGTDFSYFPVVQYMPYFLAGLVYAGASKKLRLYMGALAVLLSGGGLAWTLTQGMPSRFPPHWAWIVLPALGVGAITLLGHGLCSIPTKGIGWVAEIIRRLLSPLGAQSLYYLLGSNLILFTMAGRGLTPTLSRKGPWPWDQVIQSPLGAFSWTLVMLALLAFVALLAGRGGQKRKEKTL